MSNKRSVQGVWLIERGSGRNLISRAYANIEIDMDLIAPFLSATHTFIDKASREQLQTIDTETNRYIWEANDYLLFVMVVSKSARVGHMRFLLQYALGEFMKNQIPEGKDIATMLKQWHGRPNKFKQFGNFVDELVSQYEVTDESLVAGKSMDCLAVYSHLFRAMMRVNTDKKTRRKLVKRIKELIAPILSKYDFLSTVGVDEAGIDILNIDVNVAPYKFLREALEKVLGILSEAIKENVTTSAYRKMIFEHAMPYVKGDIDRLQTYAILDDVIRYLF
ncbi:MAG: hypothetical protein ACFFD6_00915 [Candidatus Thorarchaeota archaeon]